MNSLVIIASVLLTLTSLAVLIVKYAAKTKQLVAIARDRASATTNKQASALEHQVDDTIQRLILTAQPATARRSAL